MHQYIRIVLTVLAVLFAEQALAVTGDKIDRANLSKTFDDEFDRFSWYQETDFKEKPRSGTWRTNEGYGWTGINDIKNHTLVWNVEEQIYVDPLFTGSGTKPLGLDPFSIKDGVLSITATRAEDTRLYGYRYTSGLITTEPTFSQAYGVFEMRAKLPKGQGLWPAFWLLPVDKTWPPEIDIMEQLGHETTSYYTTMHATLDGKHVKREIPAHTIPDASEGFHTYAVDWGPSVTVFYFDDKEVAREPTYASMNTPFYILINLAVGGGWPGSPDAATQFPASYQVDWVRVWQRPSYFKP